MKIIGIVACLHGDEAFGLGVLKAAKEAGLKNIVSVIGNPKAVQAKKRLVNDDLNRCFGGSDYIYEKRRADQILSELQGCDYILDIHNTTTSVKNAMIVANLNQKTRKILGSHPGDKVAFMQPAFSNKSLIGQFADGAVSLEYSYDYASTGSALNEIIQTIKNLQADSQISSVREVYFVERLIDSSIRLPKGDNNYKFIPELDGYGFLVGEKAYEGLHQGFLAPNRETMVI